MAEYIDSKIAAQRLCISERDCCRKCRDGTLPSALKTGSRWKIPVDADPRLAAEDMPDDLHKSDELRGVPVKKRDQALTRLGILQEFDKFCAKANLSKREAMTLYTADRDVTGRSLWRWMAAYRTEGLLGLVDNRGGGKFVSQMIDDEAFELFKSMYLDRRKLSVKTCWQNVRYVNKDERKGWKVPPLAVMYRYIKNHIPLAVQVLHREGLRAYEARCAPYIQRDPDSVEPGEVWLGDHAQFNCLIRHRNKWIRPWITAWQDMRSRAIVGLHICSSPNQTTILLAMKRAVEKYGPPDSVKIDNGRDYDSESFTGTTKARRRALRAGYIDEMMVAGIYAMMDVGVSFALPYNPKGKGQVERLFATIDEQFTKTVPTWCDKDTVRRRDDMQKLLDNERTIEQAYTLDGFARKFGEYCEVYNNTAHGGAGMDGSSPAQVMATRTSRRVMAEGVAELLLRCWSGELRVGKNGVRFKGIYYGQYDPELLICQGKKVRAGYDPDDMRRLYIYDAHTWKLIAIAEQNQLVRYGQPVSEQHLRFAMRQKSAALKNIKGHCDSRLIANTDLTSLTIKAMADAAEQSQDDRRKTTDAGPKTLRPVRTPLDGQVREHKRQETVKAVKKAAGAESMEKVLDIDFSLLKTGDKYDGVRLFDDER